MVVAALVTLTFPRAWAQTWTIVPAFGMESTLTDNVDLAPTAQRKSDWVNQFTPSVRFSEIGAHSKLSGYLSLPMLVYARTGKNDYVAPEASLNGTLEAIEKLFFIDASANVSQQYLSPFGARSTSLANATQNRYTAQSYSISPYLRGEAPDGISYELRQQNLWSDAAGASTGINTNRSYTSNIDAYVRSRPRPTGGSVEYKRSDITFTGTDTGRNSESTEIERLRGLYQWDPSLQFSAIVGYEDNRFFFTQEHGATYGAGVVWHPTDRTNLDATWEHRFFGSSYHVTFDHRTPLTVWSVNASRDITSYPQQIANLPAGADVNSLLNSLFSSRVPDPAQRQTLVDQLVQDRGLPTQLSSAVPIYAQQITLVELLRASFGILGARNSILFSAYHSKNEPIEPIDVNLAPLLTLVSNSTQNGGNVVWTHQLAPTLVLAVNADVSRVTQNTGVTGATRLYALNARLSRTLSVLTTVYAGARYQRSLSDSQVGATFGNYTEFAVFVGFNHVFH